MALERKDRAQDSTTTTGTGKIDLAGTSPDAGYLPFVSLFTSGATVRYLIINESSTEWEVGEGVFTDATPDTLSRVTVFASSNSGSLVDFSAGTKNVYCVLTSKDIDDSYGMARQAIINGNFDVWQRGTSVALADLTNAFLADRWKDFIDKNGGTLPTLTRSRQLLTSGDIPNAFYYSRLNTNGAGSSLGVSSFGNISQNIEYGTRLLCGNGKKVTVSFWARSDIANKRICPTLIQQYGTGGSPSSAEFIKGTPITLTSTWTKYTATFTTNTLSGKTFGTDNNDFLTFVLWYMWGTTAGNDYIQTSVTAETFVGSGNIDIAQAQLCAGDVALPFQPKSYEEEVNACSRYFKRYGSTNFRTPACNVTTAAIISATFPFNKPMRITPTSSLIGSRGTDWFVKDNQDNVNTTGTFTGVGVSPSAGKWAFTSGTFTPGLAYHLAFTANGYLDFDAEL